MRERMLDFLLQVCYNGKNREREGRKMLKKVRIRISTERTGVAADLFSDKPVAAGEISAPERSEMTVEGRYHDDGTRVSIAYEETEISGMEGTRATLFFQKSDPGQVTLARTGSVKTALIFEAGCRHECLYQTPIMPFEVCVQTAKVQNAIEAMGTMELDYISQIKGAEAERTRMRIVISPAYNKPQGL
jgi:uncharacterized beta-barrel protein YwiB (DUF1934 family)